MATSIDREFPFNKKSPQSHAKKRLRTVDEDKLLVRPPRNTASRIAQASPTNECHRWAIYLDSKVVRDLAFLRNENVILVEKVEKTHTHTHST